MTISKISRYLNSNGLPKFWQYVMLIGLILSVSLILVENSTIALLINTAIIFITIFGFIYQFTKNNRSILLWGTLFVGLILLKISIIFQGLSIFEAEINESTPFWIEQFGILLTTIFAFSVMFLFEKQFRLCDIATDFTILVLSLAIFTLLVSPKLLNIVLYDLDLIQKLIIVKLVLAFIMLSMTMLLHITTKKIQLNNVILTISIVIIIAHFFIQFLNSLNIINIKQNLSLAIYQTAGIFILIFAFIENTTHHYPAKRSLILGSTLLWIASISAICIIPLSIFIRWFNGHEPIGANIIGVASLILSSFVIWRLIILINKSEEQGKDLKKIAYTDPITYLPNYHGLIEKIEPNNIENTLLIAISIDDFRSINDLYGREFGDEVLVSLAQRLKSIPELVIASRVSTALFFIVLKVKKEDIHHSINAIQKKLGVWDIVSGKRLAVPLTYGLSHSKRNTNPKQLIQQAEEALTLARSQHNSYSIFYKIKNKQLPRHQLREILQRAIDLNHLPVHFQPIYNLETGSLTAMELLIRVQSKDNGLLMPGQFLEQAQAYGLLTPLTKICVNMIAKNYDQLPDVTININLPSYMLNSPSILLDFIACFEEAKLPTNHFCIEVMEDQDIPAEQLLQSIEILKKIGFSIAMDDFGAGYSSLSRLSMLPFDTVKIDRSLLLAASSGNKTILESAITLIKRLNISVVVEGVETTKQLNLIRLLGADSVQGFLLSKPVDINTAKDFPLNATNIIAEF